LENRLPSDNSSFLSDGWYQIGLQSKESPCGSFLHVSPIEKRLKMKTEFIGRFAAAHFLAFLVANIVQPLLASDKVFRDRRLFAQHTAGQISADLQVPPDATIQVGVFPFGDSRGLSSASMGNISIDMQGELIDAFLTLDQPRVTVPSAKSIEALARQARTSVIDLLADPEGRQQLLSEMGLDYAIWGMFGLTSGKEALTTPGKSIEVQVFVACRTTDEVKRYDGRIDKGDFVEVMPSLASPPLSPPSAELEQITAPSNASQRFQVEIVDHREAPIPLQVVSNPESEFHNCLLMRLSEHHRNTPYSIRIRDLGGPSIGLKAAGDRPRMHQVVVKVDGISSIWPKTDGQEHATYEPAAEHPFYSHKWVLTPPGLSLVADPNVNQADLQGARLVPTQDNGRDGALLILRGFQAGPEKAHEFVFAFNPRESLAVTRGLDTNDIGLITVYFYAQQFPQHDAMHNYFFNLYQQISFFGTARTSPVHSSAVGSTKLGRALDSKTYTVGFNIERNPVQIWRIYYRYGDENLSDLGKQPLALRPLQSGR
jgi:hypothetical protein